MLWLLNLLSESNNTASLIAGVIGGVVALISAIGGIAIKLCKKESMTHEDALRIIKDSKNLHDDVSKLIDAGKKKK